MPIPKQSGVRDGQAGAEQTQTYIDAVAAPWTAWVGGLLGAAYAVIVVVLAKELGAATLTALVVTGQLIGSVVLDHYGLLDFDVRAISAGRLAGCGLLLSGTFLIWKF